MRFIWLHNLGNKRHRPSTLIFFLIITIFVLSHKFMKQNKRNDCRRGRRKKLISAFDEYFHFLKEKKEKNSQKKVLNANVAVMNTNEKQIQIKKESINLPVSSNITSLAINLSKSSIMVKVGILIVGRSVVVVVVEVLRVGFKAMNMLSIALTLSSHTLCGGEMRYN